MRTWISTIGLAAALLGGSALQAGAATHCRLTELGEVPVTSDGANLVIEAQINGEPVKMIVDTGTLVTAVFRGSAQKLRLAPTSAGDGQGAAVRVKAFQVGEVTVDNTDMAVTDGGGDAQGRVGAGFLLRDDVEFDLPEGKIRFFKPGSCEGDQVVYWGQAYSVAPMLAAADPMIEVKVLLNGQPVVARMDTGAACSGVTTAAAARLGVTGGSQGAFPSGQLQCSGAAAVWPPVAGRPAARARYPKGAFVGGFSTLAFGDETIRNAQLVVGDLDLGGGPTGAAATPAAAAPEMALGADFFRSHRIYVSQAQQQVYVSYTGGPVFQADLGDSGPSASR
jgi:predicted aspartyl protease